MAVVVVVMNPTARGGPYFLVVGASSVEIGSWSHSIQTVVYSNARAGMGAARRAPTSSRNGSLQGVCLVSVHIVRDGVASNRPPERQAHVHVEPVVNPTPNA